MADAIAMEAGGRVLQEDGTSVLLLETQTPIAPLPGTVVGNFAPIATYKVEIAWGQTWRDTGIFLFGISSFGGSDTLGNASFSGPFNVPYGDLTDRVRTIETVRGRDDLLSQMQAGTLSLTLRDDDGLLNTRNTASPLHGFLYTGIPVRVTAYTTGGVAVPIYYGFVETITADPGGRYGTAQITAVDLFDRLRRERPTLGALSAQTTGSLINNLLLAIGWDDPSLISLAVGDALPDPYTRADGTNDVLTLIEEALTSERGYFFISGSGAVTYRSRYNVLVGPSLFTVDRKATSAPSTLDAGRIVNRWTVQRAAMDGTPLGTPQVAAAPTTSSSYLRYHYIDGSILSPTINTDVDALALAQYLVSKTQNPSGVGWSVPISPSDPATLDQLILRDLGDRVTLTVDPLEWPGYSSDYTIEQIKHTIITDPGQPRQITTWGLAEVPLDHPFTFGSSTFGGADVLVY